MPGRYGVAAINIVDDLTPEAVLAAAAELEAPLIVQTSLKTVKAYGAETLFGLWRNRVGACPVPVSLHLDHCPDREWISTCLRIGWNSVLFDTGGRVHPVEVSARFIEETDIYSFAPAIGTAHGLYEHRPELHPERVTELVAEHPIPMVLHGGTGPAPEQFTDLISRGCAKVNISTALKIAFVDGYREHTEANPGKHAAATWASTAPRWTWRAPR